MADSTLSDADKIRAKRLAKLGGNSASSPANGPSSGTQQPLSNSQEPSPARTPVPASSESSPAISNPFEQLGMEEQQEQKKSTPHIKIQPRPKSPAKRDISGSERPKAGSNESGGSRDDSRPRQREPESLEVWQDKTLRSIFRVTLKPEETRDRVHGYLCIFLASTREDMIESNSSLQLNIEALESAITEAASKAPESKPFNYLLQCFKRATRSLRNAKHAKVDDARIVILQEARRLCMSYCIFAVTMPEMFGENVSTTNPLVDHLLNPDSEGDSGICNEFLDEAVIRMEDDEGIRDALVGAAEELSTKLSTQSMMSNYRDYMQGLRNLIRKKPIAEAIALSPKWAPDDVAPQDIETQTLLGPFFRLSHMQLDVARNFFSAPKTRDRAFINNAQNAARLEMRNHQNQLFELANTFVRASPVARGRMLNWFAMCVNKNHKKRAMRVDYKTVSSDGFMLNVTIVLDQLCEPFMDASFSKIEKIDVDYLHRNPRVDISDETKINADQKAADEFYSHSAEGTNNFISECFFLTVAAHHYGTEAAQERMSTSRKLVERWEKDLKQFEAERHKYLHDPRYRARFEQHVQKVRTEIDNLWSTIHATYGILVDELNQARSMQFMRYVIVWLLRLASRQNLPKERLHLPLSTQQSDVFQCLPEYFLEDIVENFKFITSNIPQIMTPQQCEEIVQICITFLRNSEYVKNPGVKSGLVTILYYGVQPFNRHTYGLLGELLIGSPFAHKHLLHALMKFYIEAESTGTHTQFYDKFNIRYEIFQVIKTIWKNIMYRENLAREATANTDFFVQFVNMIVNDVTFVLDESLSSFLRIHELTKEISSPAFAALDEEERKSKQELLDDQKGKAKSYMGLTRESMETLILFTDALPDAFTMPEVVQRLADMLDYNLDTMVGERRAGLRVENPEEYKWNPRQLLADIVKVFLNLAGKERFVHAIARDGRSYKPGNFVEAERLLREKIIMAPEEMAGWRVLGEAVAASKAADEEAEADLGEIPEEFLDPLLADLMMDPVILPTSRNTVDRATIRSHLLSDPNDPFNRTPLKIEEVVPNTELKARIEAWKAERLAVTRAAKAAATAAAAAAAANDDGAGVEAMDTS